MTATYPTLADYVRAVYDGRLCAGIGTLGVSACIMTARSEWLGLARTDDPAAVGRPDDRPLNDAPWSNKAIRAVHMLRLDAALEPWGRWTEAERRDYVERVLIATVRELVAELPGLPEAVRTPCRGAATLWEAMRAALAADAASAKSASKAAAAEKAAAWAACRASGRASAWAARAARTARASAEVAGDAACAARWAGRDADAVLIRAVDLRIAAVAAVEASRAYW